MKPHYRYDWKISAWIETGTFEAHCGQLRRAMAIKPIVEPTEFSGLAKAGNPYVYIDDIIDPPKIYRLIKAKTNETNNYRN